MKTVSFWVLALSAMVGTSAEKKADFGAATREANALVEKQAKAEAAARAKAQKAFIFGMKEGGSTFGLGQVPLQVKEKPAIDAKVMAEARAKLRAALPEKPSEADEVRLAAAELALEERGGCQASRAAAFAKLAARTRNVDAVKAAMAYLKRRNEQTEILALAERVIADSKDDLVLKSLGLGWRWFAAARLGDKPLKDATKALVDALPLNDTVAQNAYLTLAWDGSRDPKDFDRLLKNIDKIKSGGVKSTLYTEIFRGRCQACDYAGIKEWYPTAVKTCDKRMVYPMTYGAMAQLRCWADAAEYAKLAYDLNPKSAEWQLKLARALLGCGRRADAVGPAAELAANEKASAKQRFVGRVLGLFAAAKDPSEIAPGILAMEKDSGAKDGEEFAAFVFEANFQAFEPLMTSEHAKWLQAAREAVFALLHPEERVVHTVHYRASAPRTAALAEAEGLFDPGWFDGWEVERRFAPYQTYAWSQKGSVMANLRCKPERKLDGVKGEGRSAELVAFYDETGVHIYTRFRDPSAAKYRLGEAPGCGFEFTVQPDASKGWNQIFTKTDAVKDLNEVQWDSVDFGHKPTFDLIRTDSTTTDDAFLFHTFIPWAHVYTKLPKDGDTWNTVMCASMPAGTYVLGGGAVHELGRGMKLRFAMDAEQERLVRRAVVRRAAGDFLRWRAPWENVAMWQDEVLGDPEFWNAVVKGWLSEREAAAKALVKRPDAEVTDEEYAQLGEKYLRDWADPRLTLDGLRANWLNGKFFGSF